MAAVSNFIEIVLNSQYFHSSSSEEETSAFMAQQHSDYTSQQCYEYSAEHYNYRSEQQGYQRSNKGRGTKHHRKESSGE